MITIAQMKPGVIGAGAAGAAGITISGAGAGAGAGGITISGGWIVITGASTIISGAGAGAAGGITIGAAVTSGSEPMLKLRTVDHGL